MTVESASYISQLNTAWPLSADLISEGDDHIRLAKTVLKTQFPNFGTTAITVTAAEVNYLGGVTSGIQGQLNAKAPLDSPTFTTAATLPAATTIGTVTAAQISYLSGVTSSIQTQLSGKGDVAGQTWSGSHDFTGATPTVPTAAPGDSSNAAASTAFASSLAFATALPAQAGNSGKFAYTDGATASWRYPVLADFPVAGTTHNAVAGQMCRLDNLAATAVTLPASPGDGDCIGIYCANRLKTNTVDGNGKAICGLVEVMTIDSFYFPLVLRYRAATGWDLA